MAASLAEAVVAVEIPAVVGTLAAVEILAAVGSSVVAVVWEVVESFAALAEVVESSAAVLAEAVCFAAGFAGWRRNL